MLSKESAVHFCTTVAAECCALALSLQLPWLTGSFRTALSGFWVQLFASVMWKRHFLFARLYRGPCARRGLSCLLMGWPRCLAWFS